MKIKANPTQPPVAAQAVAHAYDRHVDCVPYYMANEHRHEERIRHPRLAATCNRLEWTYPMGSPNVARTLLDVSTGGARMVVNSALEPGETVVVRLDGMRSERTVNIAGDVRWVAPLPSVDGRALAYVAGVRFKRTPGLLDLILVS